MHALVVFALMQAAMGDVTAPTTPQAQNPPAVQSQADQAPNANDARHRQRCRRQVVTGTRLPVMICSSTHDDERLDNESGDFLHRMQQLRDSQSQG